mmetsp:Transcript_22554/g.28455  ORF Transcript_22554/g.28455 Transcript_22554/m.28455 type:complete len:140 (-) Transcript_22554:149-568(-)|eukprot:CAMPEP_0203644324 /NCGR_PEP_ID=MMETSP0088-20131115/9751_1 /ASSEMBLY_ACC=CAM_ASM_001087 /TAXON_ID=426623 /ORGANISM="Chaetoceros affinis, Strain CCMP159" /LENGTH=139 /DNA_ID=CAMNT_0050500787 /DNA_START=45 /DNA_END=464 /DNA_ORIENTATION=+
MNDINKIINNNTGNDESLPKLQEEEKFPDESDYILLETAIEVIPTTSLSLSSPPMTEMEKMNTIDEDVEYNAFDNHDPNKENVVATSMLSRKANNTRSANNMIAYQERSRVMLRKVRSGRYSKLAYSVQGLNTKRRNIG